MNKFLYQGEMKTFTIPLVVDGVAYTPGEEAQIIFTMKRDARLQDSAIGVVQKTKDYGLVVAGTSVSVSLVFADTHDLPPGPYVCEVRVKELGAGWRVGASGVIAVRQGVQREEEVVQEIHTTEPPIPHQVQGPSGTIAIGSVTTGDPGTSVSIENVGTPQAAVLNITIPRGNTGADSTVPGPPGPTDYTELENKPVAGVDFAPAYPRSIAVRTAEANLIIPFVGLYEGRPRYSTDFGVNTVTWLGSEETPYWYVSLNGNNPSLQKTYQSFSDVLSPDLASGWSQLYGDPTAFYSVISVDVVSYNGVKAAGAAMVGDAPTPHKSTHGIGGADSLFKTDPYVPAVGVVSFASASLGKVFVVDGLGDGLFTGEYKYVSSTFEIARYHAGDQTWIFEDDFTNVLFTSLPGPSRRSPHRATWSGDLGFGDPSIHSVTYGNFAVGDFVGQIYVCQDEMWVCTATDGTLAGTEWKPLVGYKQIGDMLGGVAPAGMSIGIEEFTEGVIGFGATGQAGKVPWVLFKDLLLQWLNGFVTTISGDKVFDGIIGFGATTRPTTSATGEPASNSLISLSDADARYGGQHWFVKGSKTTVNNSTVLVNSQLVTGTLAAGTYVIDFMIDLANVVNNTAGQKLKTNFTGTATGEFTFSGAENYSTLGATVTQASGYGWRRFGKGHIVVTAPGVFSFQMAQSTAHASDTDMTALSWMEIHKVR